MRLSTVGIILLTAMVATKYFVSLEALRAEDGSFKSGIEVDYTAAIDKLYDENNSSPSNNLLAANSSTHIQLGNDNVVIESNKNNFSVNENNSTTTVRRNNQGNSEDEPLPMEQSNSLVVYDFSNPDNNIISSNYEDIVDDIPLDNGNTIINGLMLIMPRR